MWGCREWYTVLRCYIEVDDVIISPAFFPAIDIEAVATALARVSTRLTYTLVDVSEVTIYRLSSLFSARLTRTILVPDIDRVEEECANMFASRAGQSYHHWSSKP